MNTGFPEVVWVQQIRTGYITVVKMLAFFSSLKLLHALQPVCNEFIPLVIAHLETYSNLPEI